MARPRKEGVAYFSFDVDFFSNKKVKILKARYGADGIAIYIYLLCEIYKNGYYLKIDDDFEFVISDDLSMNCDKVKQVLTFLLERSMFDKQLFQSDAVLTSAGIQKRFQLAVKTRALKNPVTVKGFWILSEEETEPFIKVNPSLNNSENNKDNSEKNEPDSGNNAINKSKVNKSIYIDTAPPDKFFSPELEKAFQLFLVCRQQNGQKLNQEQIQLLRDELIGLSDKEPERMAIVKKATVSNWKSFYPLKKQGRKTEPKKKAGFNNFKGRDYNIGELETQLLSCQKGGDNHEHKNGHSGN